MSLFRTLDIPCPSCAAPVSFDLVHSVNADRRPDLRAAILARTFQQKPCPACGHAFRMEPEFSYLDTGRKQFIAVWPASALRQWAAHEERSRNAFDKAFGASAPPEARSLGEGVQARAVFGWPALSEKIIATEAGIDDRVLELAKVGVLRNLDDAPVLGDVEFRLLGVEAEALVLGWIASGTEELTEVIRVPRAAIAEIEAEPAPWQALREEIAGDDALFIDFQRMLLPAEED